MVIILTMNATEALKLALAETKESLHALERATGVNRLCIMRFKREETSLRMDTADALLEHFGYEVRKIPKTRKAR